MTLPVVLAIGGLIALLVGLFGGGIEIKEFMVPKLDLLIRILSSLIGLGLVGVAIWVSFALTPYLTPTIPQSVVTSFVATSTSVSSLFASSVAPTSTVGSVVPTFPSSAQSPVSSPVSPTSAPVLQSGNVTNNFYDLSGDDGTLSRTLRKRLGNLS